MHSLRGPRACDASSMTDAQWLEILVRMVAGEAAEEPTEGVLAVRLDEESEELTRFRVWKHGARWRAEEFSGRLRSIHGGGFTYTFVDNDGPREKPWRTERARGDFAQDEVFDALSRREATDWRPRPDDYSRPAGTPRPTTYLGRDAWEVRLTPPSHKAGDLVLVVDALDGRILQESNSVYGLFRRWEELHIVESVPDELFVWDGPFCAVYAFSDDDVPDELRDQVEAERRAEEAYRAALRLDELVVAATGSSFGHVDDHQDEAMAHWRAEASFSLHRHQLDAPDDDEDGPEGGERTIWTDQRWRWTLVTHDVPPGSLAGLVADLQARTRALSTTPDP